MATALALVLAIGGGTAWLLERGSSQAQAATRTVETVTAKTVDQTVSATGTIEPATEADLSFAVSGTVTGLDVAVGDKVTKGQALATVGRSTLKAAVTVASAALTSAEDALASTSGSSTQLASAEAQVASAKSSLASAKADLAAATLRSTITGTVASVDLDKGDTVGSGSSSSTSSTPSAGSSTSSSSSSSSSAQIVVISTSSWVVDASVGSSDLGSLKKGLQATITPTDSTKQVFGTVKSVGIVASSDSSSTTSGSATFPVVIAVTGSPTGLYAGGSASVSIIVKQLSNVLTVPTAALHSSGGKTYVYQEKDGQQVSTEVTVGTTYGNSTQITKGLASGDQVVVTTVTPARTASGGSSSGGNGGGFGGTGGPPAGAGGPVGGSNG